MPRLSTRLFLAFLIPKPQFLPQFPLSCRYASTSSLPGPSTLTSSNPPESAKASRIRKAFDNAVMHANQFEGVSEGGLRMLIFGKPGSGKGTLSARLVEKYDLHFISTGDVLRREIMQKTAVGKEAEEVVRAGGLVSDELMLKIIESELDKLHGKSWILDGYPRTLRQAGLLDSALNAQGRPLNMIIHLRVPDSVIMKRIEARWVHLPSGRVYNTQFESSAPKVPGLDDVTGEALTKRPDDTPEIFQKRLQAFYKSTSPLLDYFQDRHLSEFHELEGCTSDEIWPHLAALVDRYHALQREEGSREEVKEEVEVVRREADDLRDSEGEVEQARAEEQELPQESSIGVKV